jgi:hypothetical protein
MIGTHPTIIRIVEKRKDFSVTHDTFPSMSEWHDTIVELSCALGLGFLRFITRSSWPNNFVKCSGLTITSLSADVMRGHLLSRYKLLDQNELRTRSETSFVWIIDHDGCTRTQVRSWWHGSKVARHHVGYLLNIGDARVPTMHNDHEKALVKLQRYDSVIGVTKEYTWARVNDMQALSREVKQGFETNKTSCQ